MRVSHRHTFLFSDEKPAVAKKLEDPRKEKSYTALLWTCLLWMHTRKEAWNKLLTYIILQSYLRTLFLFYESGTPGCYHGMMTSVNDSGMWCELSEFFLLKHQTSPHIAKADLCISHYVMIVMPGPIIFDTEIGRQWVRDKFNKVFLQKLYIKCFY